MAANIAAQIISKPHSKAATSFERQAFSESTSNPICIREHICQPRISLHRLKAWLLIQGHHDSFETLARHATENQSINERVVANLVSPETRL